MEIVTRMSKTPKTVASAAAEAEAMIYGNYSSRRWIIWELN